MDDQGEERIVLLWSKWGLCHGRRLVSGKPVCLSGNSICQYFLSFISLPFFTSSDQLTQVFNWCFLSFISLPFLHQFWPVLTHTQAHTALFASVEAGGSVQLWDLNTNTEVPAAVCKPDKVNCLNKVSWLFTSSQHHKSCRLIIFCRNND